MNKLVKIAAATGLMLGALAVTDAQITKQGNAYLLRMKFAKGQTAKYQMDMTMNMGAQKMSMSMPMTQKVTNVRANGAAEINYTMGPMSMNGKPMGNQTQSTRIVMDPSGKVIEGQNMGQTGASVSLPAKPVRVGESWTVNTKMAAGTAGPMDVKATYTLAGFQTIAGKQAAKINVKMSAAGQMSMNGSGTMLLLSSDGSLHSANINMNMKGQQQGQQMNVTSTIALKRV